MAERYVLAVMVLAKEVNNCIEHLTRIRTMPNEVCKTIKRTDAR